MSQRFAIKNFGCRATQADGAVIAAQLAARGLRRSEKAAEVDLVVVNTCTVTAEADRDARQTIRRIHRECPGAKILVTGCYAQRRPEDLAAIEGVTWVVGNSHKHRIGDVVAPQLVQIAGVESQTVPYHGELSAESAALVGALSGSRAWPVQAGGDPLGRSRPNIKVQDGCDNRCAFCIIPTVRGRSRSAPAERVVREVRAWEADHPEIVLTGINLGRWGRDLPGRPRLVHLLQRLLAETAVRRIRLSSVEPMDWSGALLELVAASPRIAKHAHMPLQSGSDRILRSMRRRYRTRHYEQRVRLAREAMPTAAIGADVMVGFPGEGAEEFEETRSFIERLPLTYLHVFSYSPREGTEAAAAPRQMPPAIKRERNRVLRQLIAHKNLSFRQSLVGLRVSAVVLAANGPRARVLSDNYLDIEIPGEGPTPRSLVGVRIEAAEPIRTVGTLVT